MSGRTQSSLTLEQVDLLDMVRRAVLRLKDTPHRQYTYVYGAVQQLATEEGKFRPGVTALSGVDQQAILDVLNEMGREGLIVPGLGEAGSSAQDFPFFRVGKKMLESSRAITTAPVPPRQELKKGSVIRTAFQSYTLQKILGEGGVGVVWQATDEEGEMWAIKVLRPKSSTSKAKRFKNELTFCRNSRHPHIINVHDHGVGGDYNQTFYVMKMLDGSLRQLLPSIPDGKQRMVYIGHILAGAEAAHMQGVVHRDIKPENILLDRRENNLLLADFGVAEFSEEDLYTIVETNDNERLGNFQYSAPEQRSRGRTVDVRSDIYAIGLLIHELFTSEVPQGVGYKKIGSTDPLYAWLDNVVEKMIQHEPSNRYASISLVRQAINVFQDEYWAQQRYDELTKQVVSSATISDQLADREPEVADVDYKAGILNITLDVAVNERYIAAFQSSYSRQSLWGKEPSSFIWSKGKTATIRVNNSDEATHMLQYFRSWLPMVKVIYRNMLEQERREEEARIKGKIEQERREIEDQKRFRQALGLK